jgi:hypothetical protein
MFSNGLGAVFVINLLAWLQMLGIGLLVFGAIYGFVIAINRLFGMH